MAVEQLEAAYATLKSMDRPFRDTRKDIPELHPLDEEVDAHPKG